ncbi:hypothetical protein CBR_g48726 [Chara braunii]|uniref:Pyruvate kinase n=1 Tax=Chara braunii TaxID=69332 RepID=A0A388K4K8_CHABU|nr:hypothetical protein CBR_g48726 [Chara braunii]|eukprot:GBG64977.1 hypothetical protein CBR_g48726 [Chara braunii]
MQATRLLLEEPVRLSTILTKTVEDPATAHVQALTKIIGTLGPESRDVETIENLLRAGMTVARFDFSWGTEEYHQETLENLKKAIRKTKRLCAVMLDTIGAELQIRNRSEKPIALRAGEKVVLTTERPGVEATAEVLPINSANFSKTMNVGDTIFLGQYLFTGSETTSVWLTVDKVADDEVVCIPKNSATLTGALFTVHAAKAQMAIPTLTERDLQILGTWGRRNAVDFISLSYTRSADDVRECKAQLEKMGELRQTQVFAKIETVQGLLNFDEILKVSDGIVLSRGNLGIDIPPEKVFLFQKMALYKCNMAGKPAVVTRVVDTMTETPRPTRAEATDVANAVLDGADAIMLGAETLRGRYPVITVKTVRRIAGEAERVFNQEEHFKKAVKYVGDPMTQLEAIASSAVRSAMKVGACVIIVFSSSGRAARLIAKYRPSMPVLVVVIPKLSTSNLRWTFTGAFQARQCLIMRGLFPMLADPRHPAENVSSTNESILKVALDYGKAAHIIKTRDRVVVCQKLGDSCVVKIIELD